MRDGKTTRDRVQELAATMYAAQIAKEIGVSRQAVSQILEALGIEAQPYESLNQFCSACSEPAIARGYCSNHYYRWRRYGDPLVSAPLHPLALCEDCGKDCTHRSRNSTTPGRYIGADGRKRCEGCHCRYDAVYRADKRARGKLYASRWRAKQRLVKIIHEVT